MKLFGTGNVSEHELIASIGFPAAIFPKNGKSITDVFFIFEVSIIFIALFFVFFLFYKSSFNQSVNKPLNA